MLRQSRLLLPCVTHITRKSPPCRVQAKETKAKAKPAKAEAKPKAAPKGTVKRGRPKKVAEPEPEEDEDEEDEVEEEEEEPKPKVHQHSPAWRHTSTA